VKCFNWRLHVFACEAATIDELLRELIAQLVRSGQVTHPRRGEAREVLGAAACLTNPLARLSRSETRGRIFSCLGEFLWYLSRSDQVAPMQYYLSRYGSYAEDDGTVHGAYGPRVFNFNGVDQMRATIQALRSNRDTRQGVIQIFDHSDVQADYRHVPCTCVLQYGLRDGRLHAITYMRSNDIHRGLPHDVFAFTMFQELVARSLDAALGTYVHFVGSLHLYEKDVGAAHRYLGEGLYSSTPMPGMPMGDPWPELERLLEVESLLQSGAEPASITLSAIPYWADLGVLLSIFSLQKQGRYSEIPSLRDRLSHSAYRVYVDDRLRGEGT
jgi:thymidylate synthase